ncbi:pheromone-binding protein Gp-9-like [Andrena cerasifolii]|uniref:pheromone-binding protein Gp-9-like n=1 Tax=Andrena cerasifolii TaxID=2819439 RepID=UPI0040382F27
MKCTLFLMLAGLAFMAAHANPTPETLAYGLSQLFHIDLRQAEICIHKTAATIDDLRTLEDVATARDKSPADEKSIRRASCTLTCCAQTQGTMTGSKIEVEAIQILIQKSNIPEYVKATANSVLNTCKDEVKTITDECLVSYAFFRCFVIQSRNFDD